EVNQAHVLRDLTRALDRLKTGNDRPPTMSSDIMEWIREAWVLTSLEYGAGRIRSGYLLAALLADESLALRAHASSPELARLNADEVQRAVTQLVAGSAEDKEAEALAGTAPSTAGPTGTGGPSPLTKTPALDQFTINLTERARKGEIDPVVGRDFEIRQMIDI